MSIWPLVLFGSLLFLLGVWIYQRLPQWRAADARACRTPLTEAQFGEQLFTPDLSHIATRLRRVAADRLGKDLSQLHPDDRFTEVLANLFDSMDTVELLMAIEDEFGIELDDATVTSVETFRDLVNAVAARRPFLAKWRRKLGQAIEGQFGVSLSREELARIGTPGQLVDALATEFKDRAGVRESCQSQRAFYLLRSAMMRTLRATRSVVKPGTQLRALIHWSTRRTAWPQLRDAVAARQWPTLVRPRWANWFIYGFPLLGGAALVAGLPALADWTLPRSDTLGLALSFAVELRGLIVIPLVIFSWVLLVRVSKPLSFSFPRGIYAVGDLLPFVVTSAQMAWTREQIEELVREIVIKQLQLPTERYQESARFVEELGLEAGPETP